ncbi:hypothetical protein BCR34DRAFT_592084 [Clohesyomyces aquaticus]|uniref:Uncharacterized protein n=1 Tax=Clohesyomyces aquaticus TaxID=1231657 RepID=A0A1Y1YV34_9PLEO|nr:hypothetical protein BCR34DRAFT_592084 [Clohesyomyces aquaticus]
MAIQHFTQENCTQLPVYDDPHIKDLRARLNTESFYILPACEFDEIVRVTKDSNLEPASFEMRIREVVAARRTASLNQLRTLLLDHMLDRDDLDPLLGTPTILSYERYIAGTIKTRSPRVKGKPRQTKRAKPCGNPTEGTLRRSARIEAKRKQDRERAGNPEEHQLAAMTEDKQTYWDGKGFSRGPATQFVFKRNDLLMSEDSSQLIINASRNSSETKIIPVKTMETAPAGEMRPAFFVVAMKQRTWLNPNLLSPRYSSRTMVVVCPCL